ncbi:response regulator transcription factor [soil metagenome]
MIDDDTKLSALTKQYVAAFGIELETVDRPSLGLSRLAKEKFDVLVLDIMLPEMDGFQLLREVRSNAAEGVSKLPVIMLTARGDVSDRVVGLELGADDYLAKPFEPRELVARLQALHRRSQSSLSASTAESLRLFADNLELDRKQKEARLDGKSLLLTTSEFAALELLMLRAGESLDRDQIMEALRGIEWDATNRVIDITMSRLRQKLGDDPKQPHFIKTIWGTGYAFIATVERR